MKMINIYYLEHKETGEPFYVGATMKKLETRFGVHQHKDMSNSIELIEQVPFYEVYVMEAYWIDQFRAWGFKLLNKQRAVRYRNFPYRHLVSLCKTAKTKKEIDIANRYCLMDFGCTVKDIPSKYLTF